MLYSVTILTVTNRERTSYLERIIKIRCTAEEYARIIASTTRQRAIMLTTPPQETTMFDEIFGKAVSGSEYYLELVKIGVQGVQIEEHLRGKYIEIYGTGGIGLDFKAIASEIKADASETAK